MPKIVVKENETLDSALKRFKRDCDRAGIQKKIKEKEHYEKPSVKKKRKLEMARKKNK